MERKGNTRGGDGGRLGGRDGGAGRGDGGGNRRGRGRGRGSGTGDWWRGDGFEHENGSGRSRAWTLSGGIQDHQGGSGSYNQQRRGQGVGSSGPNFRGRDGYGRGVGGGGGGYQQRGYRPVHDQGGAGSSGRRGVGGDISCRGGTTIALSASSGRVGPSEKPHDPLPETQSLRISSVQQLPSSLSKSTEQRLTPMKRPDSGGKELVRLIRLRVNHFPVYFNPTTKIRHYHVDVKPEMNSGNCLLKKPISKFVLRMIREKLFSDNPEQFPMQMTTYDGENNIFSAISLPTGKFKVELSDGEDSKTRSYMFTFKLVNELSLSNLMDYLCGNLMKKPHDILQALDLVMKENLSRHMISVGRNFYYPESKPEDDLGYGIAALKGFQQSLKPTSQGLALCLDYSVVPFRKKMGIIAYLAQHLNLTLINGGPSDFRRKRGEVINALKGLKVTVEHRNTKQKYTIAGLTEQKTCDIYFDLEDPEGNSAPRSINLVDYFRDKYKIVIKHLNIPCLDLGKNGRKNYVPMELCALVEGQRYPKEQLDDNSALLLKKISLVPPKVRRNAICEMLHAEDGPCGDVTQNFELRVDQNMTRVDGRVIKPPVLKLGGSRGSMDAIRVENEKCQWNLVGKSVVKGVPVGQWALIDFSWQGRFQLNADLFIGKLRSRSKNLGIYMAEPLVQRSVGMHEFDSPARLQGLLTSVIEEVSEVNNSKLQIIVCVMAARHPGYKYLKFVSETQIGVVTQCCLCNHANLGKDQYLANLCLKINAKLGGSNVELIERLPCFGEEDHVMFVGSDVNHPAAHNLTCPSIAAVVATMNWPAANRYAARVFPQDHRKEKILNFGDICLDLVNTYARFNKVRPKKIMIFRDGVSESQFDMVLNEELLDMMRAIFNDNYRPTITLVVAQKRHHTRLFLENERDGGASGNLPPGTVVDSTVVHPFQFDFYLCSHYGSLGTSKPTHYYVLWDEHGFTSDELQRIIYNLCFTFARCTKPVSLVPPVYYADLVAYRGRLFQEVITEFNSPASSSSSSIASFDDSFYKLHPELQNIMFFV